MTFDSLLFHGSSLLAQVDGAGADGAAQPSNPIGPLGLMLAIGVLFYFMILRPDSQRRAQQDSMRSGLKKNDRIVTIGGIHGTIVNTSSDSDEVTIRVDEATGTKLRISRSAVQTVLDKEKQGSSKETAG